MKTLKKFDFPERGTGSSYDWDTILDGEIHILESGKDFECKSFAFRAMAISQAHKRGKDIQSALQKDGSVVIKTIDATPEQIERWEALDAGRKERAKARRAAEKIETNGV